MDKNIYEDIYLQPLWEQELGWPSGNHPHTQLLPIAPLNTSQDKKGFLKVEETEQKLASGQFDLPVTAMNLTNAHFENLTPASLA